MLAGRRGRTGVVTVVGSVVHTSHMRVPPRYIPGLPSEGCEVQAFLLPFARSLLGEVKGTKICVDGTGVGFGIDLVRCSGGAGVSVTCTMLAIASIVGVRVVD